MSDITKNDQAAAQDFLQSEAPNITASEHPKRSSRAKMLAAVALTTVGLSVPGVDKAQAAEMIGMPETPLVQPYNAGSASPTSTEIGSGPAAPEDAAPSAETESKQSPRELAQDLLKAGHTRFQGLAAANENPDLLQQAGSALGTAISPGGALADAITGSEYHAATEAFAVSRASSGGIDQLVMDAVNGNIDGKQLAATLAKEGVMGGAELAIKGTNMAAGFTPPGAAFDFATGLATGYHDNVQRFKAGTEVAAAAGAPGYASETIGLPDGGQVRVWASAIDDKVVSNADPNGARDRSTGRPYTETNYTNDSVVSYRVYQAEQAVMAKAQLSLQNDPNFYQEAGLDVPKPEMNGDIGLAVPNYPKDSHEVILSGSGIMVKNKETGRLDNPIDNALVSKDGSYAMQNGMKIPEPYDLAQGPNMGQSPEVAAPEPEEPEQRAPAMAM